MEQGVPAAQADAIVFQVHEEEVLRQHFVRWICFIFAVTVATIPVCLGLFLWLVIEFHAYKETACGSPLQTYAIGAMVIISVKTFNNQLIRCFCCWGPDPESPLPEQPPPNRVKVYRMTLELFIFVWHILGVIWVSVDAPDVESSLPSCGEAAPELLESVKVYASFNIAVTIFQALAIIGLRRVFQIVYRTGLVNSSSAAPEGTLEKSTAKVDAQTLEAHVQENPSCPVCMEDYKPGDNDILKVRQCGHIFHRDCLKSWMKVNRTCPLCRLDLVSGTHGEDAAKGIGAAQEPDTPAPADDDPAADVIA